MASRFFSVFARQPGTSPAPAQPRWRREARVSGYARQRSLKLESLESRQLLASIPFGATSGDLGEFMLGSVAVTPVFFESDGSLDASTEDWTAEHIDEVLGNIDEGLDWWVDALAAQSSVHSLEFTVDDSFAATPVQTRYEPISRRSNDYALYVSEFLDSQGYNSGSLETDIKAFNHAQREKHNTDWSFTIVVAPSVNDADEQFAPGGSFRRAFAFAGGLFMVVPSTRPASTITHETGHMFWARDEYLGGGTYYSRRGYYNTQNDNAADSPVPGFVQQPSIMASGSLLETAYQNYTSPESTFAMLGWQDSDNDGIFDVVDVPHRLTGSGYFDSATSTYKFSGTATVQTLPNLNTSGQGNDITINRIRTIEYRVDNGPWQIALQPDAHTATIDLSLNVPSNASQIEIRARDSETTVVSNTFAGRLSRADATTAPGINGFVWIDSNKNGLRDLGEFGAEGWAVELVDDQGEVLELSDSVEPDDYPDGQLASGFHPGLTLTAVGTDADGRVAVFADFAASTGSKIFRGFSRGSSTYRPTWTESSRQLQATFSTPTTVVAIDAIGASADAKGRLDAFDNSGRLIARYTTSPLAIGEAETMRVAVDSDDIAFVTIGAHSGTSIRLDNLVFGPEASTTTDQLGGYALPSLAPGTYNVQVTPLGNFQGLSPAGGIQQVDVLADTATTDVDFGFQNVQSLWQNSIEPLDVNNDTIIAPIDVLLIINLLNAGKSGDLRDLDITAPPFVDVNGDNFLSPIDALLIINELNKDTP